MAHRPCRVRYGMSWSVAESLQMPGIVLFGLLPPPPTFLSRFANRRGPRDAWQRGCQILLIWSGRSSSRRQARDYERPCCILGIDLGRYVAAHAHWQSQ